MTEGKRVKTSFLISTSGSGQMLPLPMNEFVQENLREIGIDVELVPIEWNALTAVLRKGFMDRTRAIRGDERLLQLRGTLQCFRTVFPQHVGAATRTERHELRQPRADRLIEAAEGSFDPKRDGTSASCTSW